MNLNEAKPSHMVGVQVNVVFQRVRNHDLKSEHIYIYICIYAQFGCGWSPLDTSLIDMISAVHKARGSWMATTCLSVLALRAVII